MIPVPEQFPEHEALFDELVSGAIFDIIHAVHTKCAGWDSDLQQAMVALIVVEIAARWGIVDEKATEEEGT